MTVNFWNFSKKANSTARPSGNPASVFDVRLKDTSGILNPVLEIYNSVGWNPSALCYAQIPNFGRYYNVQDWQWIGGRWECTLAVDPLASWKTEIGTSSHYITRSSAENNIYAVDDFYPSLGNRPEFYSDVDTFGFEPYGQGYFVLAIAAEGTGAGPVTYYIMQTAAARDLVNYMLQPASTAWTTGFTGFTDTLYRSIYSPFDYIKSCMWFPVGELPQYNTTVHFGNYDAGNAVVAYILPPNNHNWPIFRKTLSLPSGWTQMEAKYKIPPYGALYVVFNPFGIIELNPLDFSNASGVMLELLPDYISGDAILKIYKVTNAGYVFVTQKTARIAVEIPLTASSVNYMGLITGGLGAAGSIIGAATASTGAGIAIGAISAASSVVALNTAAVPTLSASVGSMFGGPRAMEGVCELIFATTNFASEDNADHGKPLLATRTINTIPGYIKCAEGHISIPAYTQEIEMINEYLKGGFYYE